MSPVPEKCIASPDKRYEARLSPSVRSMWDLSHASLALQDLVFGSRIFGWHGIWSPCSRYFSVAEWHSPTDAVCPNMQLLIIDVSAKKECVVEHVKCGFIEPMYFVEDKIKFTKISSGMEKRTVELIALRDLVAWRPVDGPSVPDLSD